MDNSNEKQLETIHFIRIAHKKKDGQDGLLYLHTWGTGYEELIFPNNAEAIKFIERRNKSILEEANK